MANLTHFMIPSDDVARAKRFYSALSGWKIDPVPAPVTMGIGTMQYHEITTGPVEPGVFFNKPETGRPTGSPRSEKEVSVGLSERGKREVFIQPFRKGIEKDNLAAGAVPA